jgi:hypothetical protein
MAAALKAIDENRQESHTLTSSKIAIFRSLRVSCDQFVQDIMKLPKDSY